MGLDQLLGKKSEPALRCGDGRQEGGLSDRFGA